MESITVSVPALREFGYWMYRYRRTWRGSAVISVVNPLLFILAMGTGLGKLVNAQRAESLHGVPYLHFVAPGLLAAAAMQTAFLEASGPVQQAAQPGGNYRLAVAAPMRPADVFAGHLLFIAFRSAVSAAAVVAVTVAWGAVGVGAGLLLVPAAVLTGLAFAAPVAAFAVAAERRASINAVFRFVVMPLYMFSGTFYPISQLPGWLHTLVLFSPLWHSVALCRAIALHTATAGGTAVHLAVLLGMAAAGTVAGRRTYRRRLSV